MTKAVILKCRQGTRFHLGEFARERSTALLRTSEYIHSDVIFSAFITALSQLREERVEVFKAHFESGVLRFSSGFYAVESREQKLAYLLPKPLTLNLYRGEESTFEPKKFKKIQFLSKGVWEKAVSPSQWFLPEGPCVCPNSKCVFLKEEILADARFELSIKQDTQKVRVRNAGNSGNLYTQTDLVMQGNDDFAIHWYFLVDSRLVGEDEELLWQAIKVLALNNIGGDRSAGSGSVAALAYSDFNLQVNKAVDGLTVSLGLIFPDENETENLIYYQTKYRGGMYYDEIYNRFPAMLVLTEGAIINGKISPRILDWSKEHRKQWKYSSDFCLPLPEGFNH